MEQQSVGPEVTAAIAAAVARFEAETAPSAASAGREVSPWQRAALLEGISAKQTIEDLEGGMRWRW
jgi:hypothetical protein